MPTLSTSPGHVVTRAFGDDLENFGITNIELFPARLINQEDNTINDDYLMPSILNPDLCASFDLCGS